MSRSDGDRRVAVRERLADAQRVGQLQTEAAPRIEGVAQILLQRLEAARRPQRRFALLGLLRKARAHRQHVGIESEQVPSGIPHEREHFLELGRRC